MLGYVDHIREGTEEQAWFEFRVELASASER